MKSFAKVALQSIKTSGTIKPSSKFLINSCLKKINFEQADLILEFGPGDGCMSEEILRRKKANCKVLSIELNEDFYQHCNKKFADRKDIEFIQGSAWDFEKILAERNLGNPDVIVSSLPLSLFENKKVSQLIEMSKQSLKDKGFYIQFQYSMGKFKIFKQHFKGNIQLDFTLRNIPPAITFICQK